MREQDPPRNLRGSAPEAAPSLHLPGTPLEDPLASFFLSSQGRQVPGRSGQGNLGPSGAGRARPARAASLAAAPTARLGPAVRPAEPGLAARPAWRSAPHLGNVEWTPR